MTPEPAAEQWRARVLVIIAATNAAVKTLSTEQITSQHDAITLGSALVSAAVTIFDTFGGEGHGFEQLKAHVDRLKRKAQ